MKSTSRHTHDTQTRESIEALIASAGGDIAGAEPGDRRGRDKIAQPLAGEGRRPQQRTRPRHHGNLHGRGSGDRSIGEVFGTPLTTTL